MNKRAAVIATSRDTRGGISSVLRMHESMPYWKKWQCSWIETHIDGAIWKKLFMAFTGFVKFISSLSKVHIYHIHLSEPVSAFRKLPYVYIASLLNKRVVVHFHSFSVETTVQGKYRYIYRYIFSSADAVIVLSEFWRDKLTEFLGSGAEDKIHVVYNPCVPNSLSIDENNSRSDPSSRYILYAGTLNARKGYADLIVAFSNISRFFPDLKLKFLGNGDIEIALDLVKKLGIKDKVDFLGWKVGAEKDAVFNSATVFCLPSYAEGLPMAVLDAWSFSLPVICTPVGGLVDFIEDGENCMVFDPGDVEGLTLKLKEVLSDENLKIRLSEAGVVLSKDVFSTTEISNRIDRLYLGLM